MASRDVVQLSTGYEKETSNSSPCCETGADTQAQHIKFGMSFVGQVVSDTEPFFFFGHFFFARPRRFGEKKVTRKHRKKAHGLSYA